MCELLFICHHCPAGLIIIEAVYGNLSNSRDAVLVNDEYPPVVDVTIAVQAMVNNSKLTIPGGHSKVAYALTF